MWNRAYSVIRIISVKAHDRRVRQCANVLRWYERATLRQDIFADEALGRGIPAVAIRIGEALPGEVAGGYQKVPVRKYLHATDSATGSGRVWTPLTMRAVLSGQMDVCNSNLACNLSAR